MEKYPKPWQVLPAKIIELALVHAGRDSDFDQQISFLLLDIGVETALKVYLTNKKQDIEKINFYDLLEKTKELALKDKVSLDLNEILHFHRVRNKLYHQGDGVMPTKDNLERYSKLAPEILKAFIDVDLSEPPKESTETTENPLNEQQKYTVTGDFGPYGSTVSIYDLDEALKIEFEYFLESCAIITEQLRPSCATRQFAMQYANIWEEWPDKSWGTWPDSDPETVLYSAEQNVENKNQRLVGSHKVVSIAP